MVTKYLNNNNNGKKACWTAEHILTWFGWAATAKEAAINTKLYSCLAQLNKVLACAPVGLFSSDLSHPQVISASRAWALGVFCLFLAPLCVVPHEYTGVPKKEFDKGKVWIICSSTASLNIIGVYNCSQKFPTNLQKNSKHRFNDIENVTCFGGVC